MTQKQKRYYKVGESVFVKELKTFAVIKELNIKPAEDIYKATVEFDDTSFTEVNLWEVDKDKRIRKQEAKRQPAGLNKGFYQVRDFHKGFSHPVSYTPTLIDAERALQRAGYMEEEVQEFLDALTIVDQADAMIDLMYFALGTLVELGVKPNRLFEIVHQANMGKLGADGKPIIRESDNKVMKPEGWAENFAPEPKIEAEIKRQTELTTR